jgi:hypothetical protein
VDPGDRHQEGAAGEAEERLDAALLVGAPHPAEVLPGQVVALQPQEGVGDLPLPAAGDPGDGDLGIVVADAAFPAAAGGEGPDVPPRECLGALAGEGADERRVGVRRGHDERGDLRLRPIERDLGLTEVDPGLTGAAGQGDEDLGGPGPPGGDGLLDDGQAARIAVLVAEPLSSLGLGLGAVRR